MKIRNILFAGLLFAMSQGVYAIEPQFEKAIAQGEEAFLHNTFGGNGKVCTACHLAGGKEPGRLPDGKSIPSLMNAAAVFPRYKNGRVMTLSDQVRGCVAKALGGTPPEYGGEELNDLVGYITSLSEGRAIDMGGAPR